MIDLTPRLATALAGRYRLERPLGKGGMATIYLAEDERDGCQVAVKLLAPELAAALGAERFHLEIATTASLQHPHIVPLRDSGESDGLLWFVMPWMEGESLRQRLARERQMPVAEAIRIAREVGAALEYAHGRGILHRDVKPDNILLTSSRAMLSDFGIARARNSAGRLTGTGVVVGTPAYMSPEQAMGERELDARSDQYSFACVVYEMLAGEPPFTGPSIQTLITKRLTTVPSRLGVMNRAVPALLEAAVARALGRDPRERFGSVGEFVSAFC